MDELKQFSISLIIFILVAAGGIGFEFLMRYDTEEGYKILDYSPTLYSNGTLEEIFVYKIDIDGKYHSLYRKWRSEVRFIEGDGERVIPLDVNITPSNGCIGYACSSFGQIETYHGRDYTIYDRKYVERNELGVYSKNGFRSGIYVVRYLVRIYPDIYIDKGNKYLFSMTFIDNAINYGSVRINFSGFEIEDVMVPLYEKVVVGENFTVMLNKRIDGPVTTAIILKKLPENFTRNRIISVDNTASLGEKRVKYLDLEYNVLYGFYVIVKFFYLLFPIFFIILFLYHSKGKFIHFREQERFLPPERRPPWLVTYIFANLGGKKIASEGLVATLLDLKRRGYINIEDGRIKVIKYTSTDPFERKVLTFLERFSDSFGISLNDIETSFYLNKKDDNALKLREELKRLLEVDDEIKKYEKTFFERKTPWAVYIFIVPTIIFTGFGLLTMVIKLHYLDIIVHSLCYWIVGLLSLVIENPIKKSFVVRWKDDYYKEKLQWDAFRKTVKMKKIDPEFSSDSLVMDWIIYGTALGVGSEAYETFMHYSGAASFVLIGYPSLKNAFSKLPSLRSLGGGFSGSGGGFVGGGGFGGGVAGAR